MKIPFTKMSGAGNDFVVIDNRNGIISNPNEFAVRVCNRRLGIGADGLLLVKKSIKADFMMHYLNADGSEGGMCGNGGRCIAQFAFNQKVVSKNNFTFDALDYLYNVSVQSNNIVTLKMKNPFGIRLNEEIVVTGTKLMTNFINTGSPHCVILLDQNPMLPQQVDDVDVVGLGRTIRYMKEIYPEGTNVNFIEVLTDKQLKIRTYERGVEDETLACGTGSVGAGIISSIVYKLKPPVRLIVRSGETLEIGFEQKSQTEFSNVTLTGSAKPVFEGLIEI